MTNRDFAYWLQGYFEIGNPNRIDINAFDIIKKHIALVFAHEKNPNDFMVNLKWVFDQPKKVDCTEAQTAEIKNNLGSLFLHEIDPTYGDKEHQKKLDGIHNKIEDNDVFGSNYGFGSLKPKTKEEEFEEEFEKEVFNKFGAKPSPNHVLSQMYGWYDPNEGIPRC